MNQPVLFRGAVRNLTVDVGWGCSYGPDGLGVQKDENIRESEQKCSRSSGALEHSRASGAVLRSAPEPPNQGKSSGACLVLLMKEGCVWVREAAEAAVGNLGAASCEWSQWRGYSG
jgi:hypothetical protein